MKDESNSLFKVIDRSLFEEPPPKRWMNHFWAGAISGSAQCLLFQPLEVVKTRLQQRHLPSSLHHHHHHHPRGLGETLRQIYTEQGLRGFWRGTSLGLWRTGPGSAMYFGSLHHLRSLLAQWTLSPQKLKAMAESEQNVIGLAPHWNLVAGAVARATVGWMMMPLTVLKVRFESSNYTEKTWWQAVQRIWRQQGLSGFYSGYMATALRDVPYASLYITLYDLCQQHAPSHFGFQVKVTSSAVLAGCIATTLTHPFDVVRTRMQLYPDRDPTLIKAFRHIVAEEPEGWRVLMRGWTVRSVRKGLSSAVAWTLYEHLRPSMVS